jgi:hypothetical protein
MPGTGAAPNRLPDELKVEVLRLMQSRDFDFNPAVSYEGQTYRIDRPTKYSRWKQKVEIGTYQNLSWKAFFADRPLKLRQVSQPQRPTLPIRATG